MWVSTCKNTIPFLLCFKSSKLEYIKTNMHAAPVAAWNCKALSYTDCKLQGVTVPTIDWCLRVCLSIGCVVELNYRYYWFNLHTNDSCIMYTNSLLFYAFFFSHRLDNLRGLHAVGQWRDSGCHRHLWPTDQEAGLSILHHPHRAGGRRSPTEKPGERCGGGGDRLPSLD